MSGKKNALSSTGKIPPIDILKMVFFTNLPIKKVKTPATNVIKLPNTISKIAQPVIKFDSIHPTVSAITVSG
jgi:hypothetical protein